MYGSIFLFLGDGTMTARIECAVDNTDLGISGTLQLDWEYLHESCRSTVNRIYVYREGGQGNKVRLSFAGERPVTEGKRKR
jgi:hypothetical protein